MYHKILHFWLLHLYWTLNSQYLWESDLSCTTSTCQVILVKVSTVFAVILTSLLCFSKGWKTQNRLVTSSPRWGPSRGSIFSWRNGEWGSTTGQERGCLKTLPLRAPLCSFIAHVLCFHAMGCHQVCWNTYRCKRLGLCCLSCGLHLRGESVSVCHCGAQRDEKPRKMLTETNQTSNYKD